MSTKQHNQAGQTLLVDEVIEVHGEKLPRAKDSISIINAQLSKENIQKVIDELTGIGKDKVITASEKSALKREYDQIEANHGIMTSQVGSVNLLEHTDYQDYNAVYTELRDMLIPILADMETPSDFPEGMTEKFATYYQKLGKVNDLLFRYNSGQATWFDLKAGLQVRVSSVFPNEDTLKLTATVLVRGENVTHSVEDSQITWRNINTGATTTGKNMIYNVAGGDTVFLCIVTYTDDIYGEFYKSALYAYGTATDTETEDKGIIADPTSIVIPGRGVPTNEVKFYTDEENPKWGASHDIVLHATGGTAALNVAENLTKLTSLHEICISTEKYVRVMSVSYSAPIPRYIGMAGELPMVADGGEPLLVGDWFMVSKTFTEKSTIYRVGTVWEYREDRKWKECTDSAKIAQTLIDVPDLTIQEEDMNTDGFTTALKRLVTSEAFINNLMAQTLTIPEDGEIKSANFGKFDEDGKPLKGFRISGTGNILAEEGVFKGSIQAGNGPADAVVSIQDDSQKATLEYSGNANFINNLNIISDGNVDDIEIQVWIKSNTTYKDGREDPYRIGDTAEGGKVFYDKGNWHDGWRYLVVHPTVFSGTTALSFKEPLINTFNGAANRFRVDKSEYGFDMPPVYDEDKFCFFNGQGTYKGIGDGYDTNVQMRGRDYSHHVGHKIETELGYSWYLPNVKEMQELVKSGVHFNGHNGAYATAEYSHFLDKYENGGQFSAWWDTVSRYVTIKAYLRKSGNTWKIEGYQRKFMYGTPYDRDATDEVLENSSSNTGRGLNDIKDPSKKTTDTGYSYGIAIKRITRQRDAVWNCQDFQYRIRKKGSSWPSTWTYGGKIPRGTYGYITKDHTLGDSGLRIEFTSDCPGEPGRFWTIDKRGRKALAIYSDKKDSHGNPEPDLTVNEGVLEVRKIRLSDGLPVDSKTDTHALQVGNANDNLRVYSHGITRVNKDGNLETLYFQGGKKGKEDVHGKTVFCGAVENFEGHKHKIWGAVAN